MLVGTPASAITTAEVAGMVTEMVTEPPATELIVQPETNRVWRRPGADPCRENEGCEEPGFAFRKALELGIFPAEVVSDLRSQFEHDESRLAWINSGEVLAFNTAGNGGQGEPIFIPGPIDVDFSESALVTDGALPGESWAVEHEGWLYELIKVFTCGNWVGRKTPLPPPGAIAPAPPQTSDTFPLVFAGGGFGEGGGFGGSPLDFIPVVVVQPPRDENDPRGVDPTVVVIVNYDWRIDNDGGTTAVPLPAAGLLLPVGLLSFGVWWWKRK